MSTAIKDTKFGQDPHFENDEFFSSTALADTAATTSTVFKLNQVFGQGEVKVIADGTVATGADETLVLSLQCSATEDGTYAEVYTVTIAASTTIEDKEALLKYIPVREESRIYAKVVITSDFDATGLSVTGFTRQV